MTELLHKNVVLSVHVGDHEPTCAPVFKNTLILYSGERGSPFMTHTVISKSLTVAQAIFTLGVFLLLHII